VKKVLKILGKPESLIRFVQDRPGHDYRYALNTAKIKKLGWQPEISFEKGIRQTIDWFRQNLNWVEEKLR